MRDILAFLVCLLAAAFVFFSINPRDAEPQPAGFTSLAVEEEDGTPQVWNPYKIKIPNGALTDNSDGTVTLATGLGGVTGPASATDNAIARFDGTTGKIIQNTNVLINDDDEMTIIAQADSDFPLIIDQETNDYAGISGNAGLVVDKTVTVAAQATGFVSHGISSDFIVDAEVNGTPGFIVTSKNNAYVLTMNNKSPHSVVPTLFPFAETNTGGHFQFTRTGTITGSNMVITNYGANFIAGDTFTYDKSGGTITVNNTLNKMSFTGARILTDGTITANNYAAYIEMFETGVGTVTNHGIYFQQIVGADTNYGIYMNEDDTSVKHLLAKDSQKTFFGTGEDAYISYVDGVGLVIDPRDVGSGVLMIGDGAAGVDYVLKFDGETTNYALTHDESLGRLILSGPLQSPVTVQQTGAGSLVIFDRTDGSLGGFGSFLNDSLVVVDENFPISFAHDARATIESGSLSPTRRLEISTSGHFDFKSGNFTAVSDYTTDTGSMNSTTNSFSFNTDDLTSVGDITFDNVLATGNANMIFHNTAGGRYLFRNQAGSAWIDMTNAGDGEIGIAPDAHSISEQGTLHIQQSSIAGLAVDAGDQLVVEGSNTGTGTSRGAWFSLETNNSSDNSGANMVFNSFLYTEGAGNLTRTSEPGGAVAGRYAIRTSSNHTITLASAVSAYLEVLAGNTTTITEGRAFNVEPIDAEGGTITKAIGVHINSFLNNGGTLTNSHSMWIEKQNQAVNNYGITLDGDDVGADLVLGEGQDAKIYYDGASTTDLIIDPDVVGSGGVTIGAHLDVQDSIGYAIETVATGTTLDDTHGTVLVDASGGAITITLPTAAVGVRRLYDIKKIDSSANAVTVDGSGSETIDGATTQVINFQYDSISIKSDGTTWWII